MLEDLTPGQKELAITMSNISERCYATGWMGNLEYVLWQAVQSGPCTYGQDTVSHADIEVLKRLYTGSNSWIYYDDETEETAIEPAKWQKKFAADTAEDPDLLDGIQLL